MNVYMIEREGVLIKACFTHKADAEKRMFELAKEECQKLVAEADRKNAMAKKIATLLHSNDKRVKFKAEEVWPYPNYVFRFYYDPSVASAEEINTFASLFRTKEHADHIEFHAKLREYDVMVCDLVEKDAIVYPYPDMDDCLNKYEVVEVPVC